MHAKFEIYDDHSGHPRFRLRAGNGEIICSSESYSSLAACLNGIESVRVNAPVADVVDTRPKG